MEADAMMRQTFQTLAVLLLLGAGGCLFPRSRDETGGESVLRKNLEGGQLEELTLEQIEARRAKAIAGLRLMAEADREEYELDEPIVVDVRLENVTGGNSGEKGRDIHTYFEPFVQVPKGGRAEWLFKFRIQRERDGKLIYRSPSFKLDDQERAKYYHYVTLPEQASIGRKFEFPAPRVRDWLEPGETYGLYVSYVVGDSSPYYVIINRHLTAAQVEMLGFKLAYVRVWSGKLFARKVTFRVKPNRKRFLFF
jgi:hypothetical protein